ncbi:TPA: 23S rRNA (adenine(2503)-C(2))-methyltransferase RlmN [Candidatus Woesearchaeota archaeon]|nr:MAG: 23S rRNA (adenine2503-C2)-methyltransferase [archaeon GW2011_AR16]HIG95530.1 23S rRNA (adenine(2503)-C(2))-methyltransferase RlmN [Candidatus Woesearchaeota archaeon]HII88422.1 23S rRNA (adenine(2503)-C(2))-methyltransferase RlmN [Candidatus Woesearchaeota archaeon]
MEQQKIEQHKQILIPPIDLLQSTKKDIEHWLASLVMRPFHARQIMRELYAKYKQRKDRYEVKKKADLPLELKDIVLNQKKEAFDAVGNQAILKLAEKHVSVDGTTKYAFLLVDGKKIESVFIPQKSKNTLCISSQVGCAVRCTFCVSGKDGLLRNLSAGEIVAQVLAVLDDDKSIDNIVFMGMGEPLHNYNAVVSAISILTDPDGLAWSSRDITVSTSGIPDKIIQLGKDTKVLFALSLHAPNNALRDQLVPINKRWPLKVVLDACAQFPSSEKHPLMIEYVLLKGVNDALGQADELAELLGSWHTKGSWFVVNLIPFNPHPYATYERSDAAVVFAFKKRLMTAGLKTFIRETRGYEIAAACGLLTQGKGKEN